MCKTETTADVQSAQLVLLLDSAAGVLYKSFAETLPALATGADHCLTCLQMCSDVMPGHSRRLVAAVLVLYKLGTCCLLYKTFWSGTDGVRSQQSCPKASLV